MSLETAMGLYGLTDFQMLWERTTDTRCVPCCPSAITVAMTSNPVGYVHLWPSVASATVDVARTLLTLSSHDCRLYRCVMAWNDETHVGVLAFRGTASMANAISDIQVSAEILTLYDRGDRRRCQRVQSRS